MGLRYFKKERHSIVLEEVSLHLDVGVKNKLKTAIIKGDNEYIKQIEQEADIIINAELPRISLNLNPDIYNGLVNLSEVLKSKGAEEDLLQLKQ